MILTMVSSHFEGADAVGSPVSRRERAGQSLHTEMLSQSEQPPKLDRRMSRARSKRGDSRQMVASGCIPDVAGGLFPIDARRHGPVGPDVERRVAREAGVVVGCEEG